MILVTGSIVPWSNLMTFCWRVYGIFHSLLESILYLVCVRGCVHACARVCVCVKTDKIDLSMMRIGQCCVLGL